MILADDLIRVGIITKSHGISGELEVKTSDQLLISLEPEFVFIRLDDCFVPFRLIEVRPKNHENCYIQLKDVETEKDIKPLLQKEVFIDKQLLDGVEIETFEDLVSVLKDFAVYDASDDFIGKVLNVDTSTINTLLELDNGAVLPLHEDIIIEIDVPERRLQLDVDEELLQLN